MDSQTLLTVLLVAAVGVIAFLAGERRALARKAAEAEAEAKAARAKVGAAAEPLALSPEPPAAATSPKRNDPPKPTEDALDVEAPVSTQPSAIDPPSASAKRPSTPVMKLAYEEDEEEVEPTKVGPAASAPPSVRMIHPAPIKKIVYDEGAESDATPSGGSFFLVSATAQTDKGLRRKRNEDSLGVLESENLFIVADGMGGYAGGDQASRMAVETIVDAYRGHAFEGVQHDGLSTEASELARAIQMANATIGEEAKKSFEFKDMGTTICAAVFSPSKQRLTIGHVGDSRCYRLRDGAFTQVTADHTMAEEGVKGPEGQALSRAVGIWPTVLIDVVMGVPRTGDVYLLCSDGLTKMLNDDIIANVLRNEEDPKVAVERLIFFANSRGGKDNITVVLVRVVPTDWKPKPSEPFSPAPSSDPPPVSGGEPPESKGPPRAKG